MRKTLHAGPTLGLGLDTGFLVVAHPAENPSREDWIEACRAIREHQTSARGLLVLSLGGSPNADQRRRALDQLPKGYKPPPMAIVTDLTVLHGVVTVMNWFLQNQQRAFRPTDIDGVAQHLKIDPVLAASLVTFAHELLTGSKEAGA